MTVQLETDHALIALIYQASIDEVSWCDCLRKISKAYAIESLHLQLLCPRTKKVLHTFSSYGPISKPALLAREKHDDENAQDYLFGEDETSFDFTCEIEDKNCCRLHHKLNDDFDFLVCFEDAQKLWDPEQAFQKLLNHFQISLRIWLKQHASELKIADLFLASEQCSYGLGFVNSNGDFLYMNSPLKSICNEGDGIKLLRNQFSFKEQNTMKSYRSILKDSEKGQNLTREFLLVKRTSGKKPYVAEISSLRHGAHTALSIPLFRVSVRKMEGEIPSSAYSLAQVFSLTESESAITHELFLNKSEQRIAEERDLSLNTVKTHRKRIYSKLDIASRAELVALIYRLFL